MKSQAENVLPIEPANVWAGETSTPVDQDRLPGINFLVTLAAAVMLLAAGASVWVYVTGVQSLHTFAAQVAETPNAVTRVVDVANHWGVQLAFAAVASGAGLFAVALLGGYAMRQRWMKRHVKIVSAAEVRSQRLLGQLADSKVSEEEAREALGDAEARLASLTQHHGVLERELEQRRQAEKTLAQQTHNLERSKDVLELHMQARMQDLQKLQRRNELILNSAAEGICGFDLQGKATFVNPAAAKWTGWKTEELVGKSEDAIFFPGKPKGFKDSPTLLKDAKGQYLPEQTFFRKDGQSFPAEYVRTPITENDKVVGAVVTFKDITERKQAEDKLSHKAAELARSNRELEQFAFVASHDLQEPLRKIQAFGDRLKVKCAAVQLDEGRDYLERMQSAAARMQTLINDLLTFSRVISSAQALVPVDLGAVTAEVLVDLEHRIEKTNAQLNVGKLPTIEADPTQMRQLMQNLIGNALKFQAPGAIPVIKISAQLITRDQLQEGAVLPNTPANATAQDQFCLLTVEDNGIGFEEQYLEKMFAVFQRLHGRSEYEGTGVGLAVCRRITERHGGLITAQSKPGDGAIFIVILPMQQPKVEEPQ